MSIDYGFCYPEGYQLGQAELDRTYAGMAALRANRVRLAVPWAQTQTAAGVYNWVAMDRAVYSAVAHGIKPLLCMAVLLFRANNATPTDWGNFCAAVANRYKAVCTDYEIHNEENSSAFFGASVDPAAYTAHLKAAYIGIKAVQPGATVILGGMAPQGLGPFGFSMDPAEFLKGVFAAGGKGFFDAVGNHPYSITAGFTPEAPSPTQLYLGRDVAVHDVMVANGLPDMKIWETEFGFPSSVVGQVNQRDYLATQTAILLGRSWVGPIFFYSYHDLTADTNASESTFGCVDFNHNRKLSYAFFESLNPGATVALSGAGVLRAVTGSRPVSALAGAGSLTAVAVPNLTATAALSGGGTLVGELVGRPRAALGSEGTLVATAVPGMFRSATLFGSGSIASTVIPTYPPRPGALSGSGTLTAIGLPQARFQHDFAAAPSTKPTTKFDDFGQGYGVASGVANNSPITTDGVYFSGGIYRQDQLSADHFSEVIQFGFPTGDRSVAPIVRSNPAGTELVTAFGHWGGSRSLQIVTLMGGVLTVRATADGQFQTTNPVRLSVQGNVYTLTVNGTVALTWTDTDHVFSGAANVRTGFGFEHRTVFGGTYDSPGIQGLWRGWDLLPSAPVLTNPAALSGSGSLTATAAARTAAALSGSGTLTGTAASSGGQSVALAGTGSLSATVVAGVAAALSGAGVATATVTGAAIATASLTGSGTLTAQTTMGSLQPAALTGSGALSSAVRADAAAALTGSGALSGTVPTYVPAALSGSGTLTASNLVAGQAALSGSGTLTATVPTYVTAALSGSGALTASTGLASSLTGSGSLTGTVVPGRAVAAGLTGSGSIAATVASAAAAPLTGSGTLTATVPASSVAYGATGGGGQGTTGFSTTVSTASWNQVTTAASEVILASVVTYNAAGSITGDTVGITCDGTAMTLVSSTALNGSGSRRIDVFKATVTAGTHALIGTMTGTVNTGREIVGNSEAFQSVTTVQAGTIAQGTSTAPSITRTGGSTSERVYVAIGSTVSGISSFTGGTQRSAAASASNNAQLMQGDCAGASSVTAGATIAASQVWACVSVRLTP